eukprot:6862400-Alexandrium_andersonii.AAC.1
MPACSALQLRQSARGRPNHADGRVAAWLRPRNCSDDSVRAGRLQPGLLVRLCIQDAGPMQ